LVRVDSAGRGTQFGPCVRSPVDVLPIPEPRVTVLQQLALLILGVFARARRHRPGFHGARDVESQSPTSTLAVACGGIAFAALLAVPAAAVASTLEPIMEIRGNGITIFDGDQTPNSSDGTSFGMAQLGGEVITQDFSMLNQGFSTLVLTGLQPVVIVGPNATDFSVVLQPASAIPAFDSTFFSVAFDPTALGIRSAFVQIESNDPFQNPYTFAIDGTAVPEPSRVALLLGALYALAALQRGRSYP
jgi:hypothetical protein